MGDDTQLSLEMGGALGPHPFSIAGRFQRQCEDVGPYVWERWKSNRHRVFVAMKCNRPQGHGDDWHGWSDGRDGISFTWTRDGKPIYPLPIGGITNA